MFSKLIIITVRLNEDIDLGLMKIRSQIIS